MEILSHEVHHYIFNIFSECDRKEAYSDRSNQDKILETAFVFFKNELMAYIIDGSSIGHVDVSKNLIYFDDSFEDKEEKVVEIAQRIKGNIYLSLEFLKNKFSDDIDLNSKIFLYPIMKSKNFNDLEKRVLEILPIGDLKKKYNLWDFYEFWCRFDYLEDQMKLFKNKLFNFQNIQLGENDFELINRYLDEHPLKVDDNREKFMKFLKN